MVDAGEIDLRHLVATQHFDRDAGQVRRPAQLKIEPHALRLREPQIELAAGGPPVRVVGRNPLTTDRSGRTGQGETKICRMASGSDMHTSIDRTTDYWQ